MVKNGALEWYSVILKIRPKIPCRRWVADVGWRKRFLEGGLKEILSCLMVLIHLVLYREWYISISQNFPIYSILNVSVIFLTSPTGKKKTQKTPNCFIY